MFGSACERLNPVSGVRFHQIDVDRFPQTDAWVSDSCRWTLTTCVLWGNVISNFEGKEQLLSRLSSRVPRRRVLAPNLNN